MHYLRPRTLRTYKSIAHRNHGECQQCHHEIKEGDEYDAEVEVFDRRIRVVKWHMYCPEDWHIEEEEYHRQINEQDTVSPEELAKALLLTLIGATLTARHKKIPSI